MEIETLLERAEQDPDNGTLIGTLLVKSAQLDIERLPEHLQERLYNLFAYAFVNVASGPHNALQTALQRALLQPAVMEYFWRRMEASKGFVDMLEKNAAAPVLLALLCTHDDLDIARKAAMALGYTGSRIAYDMLQRWLAEGNNKKLIRAAEIALPFFSATQDE
jgi:hypothetical protein